MKEAGERCTRASGGEDARGGSHGAEQGVGTRGGRAREGRIRGVYFRAPLECSRRCQARAGCGTLSRGTALGQQRRDEEWRNEGHEQGGECSSRRGCTQARATRGRSRAIANILSRGEAMGPRECCAGDQTQSRERRHERLAVELECHEY